MSNQDHSPTTHQSYMAAETASRAFAGVEKIPVDGPVSPPAAACAESGATAELIGHAPLLRIRNLAAAVPMGSALQVAETNLKVLRSRRRELQQCLNDLFAELCKNGRARGSSAETDRVTSEISALEEKIIAARKPVSKMRAERAARVARAISPQRKDAARRVLAAIDSFNDASAELLECVAVIRSAGASDESFFRVPTMTHIADVAGAILKVGE